MNSPFTVDIRMNEHTLESYNTPYKVHIWTLGAGCGQDHILAMAGGCVKLLWQRLSVVFRCYTNSRCSCCLEKGMYACASPSPWHTALA